MISYFYGIPVFPRMRGEYCLFYRPRWCHRFDDIARFVGNQLEPLLQRNGLQFMPFGYVSEGSAVMRGPLVTFVLDRFLAVTQ